jgi:hypothetical protein
MCYLTAYQLIINKLIKISLSLTAKLTLLSDVAIQRQDFGGQFSRCLMS